MAIHPCNGPLQLLNFVLQVACSDAGQKLAVVAQIEDKLHLFTEACSAFGCCRLNFPIPQICMN